MLPKITVPTFEATIPSTKQKITYRPFLVKEEKILLMAMEGKDNREIVKSVSKILFSVSIFDTFAQKPRP